ncbi:MAG: tetratricopeptide repeat protein, partial [Pseudomonadota bacterium]|nr:tetratricopeptide repeat protein [Pseudomonadota bacterium]
SKNLEVLATAWRLAQEIKKSIPEMEKAAAKSDKGDLYARLAGIYLDNDNFKAAISTGNKALKRGGIKRVDQLHIVMGMSLVNQKKYADGIKHFKKAAKDDRSKKFAVQWVQFAEGELKREEQLKI